MFPKHGSNLHFIGEKRVTELLSSGTILRFNSAPRCEAGPGSRPWALTSLGTGPHTYTRPISCFVPEGLKSPQGCCAWNFLTHSCGESARPPLFSPGALRTGLPEGGLEKRLEPCPHARRVTVPTAQGSKQQTERRPASGFPPLAMGVLPREIGEILYFCGCFTYVDTRTHTGRSGKCEPQTCGQVPEWAWPRIPPAGATGIGDGRQTQHPGCKQTQFLVNCHTAT